MVRTRDMVPPGSVIWCDFWQATDPASNPDNEVGPGQNWFEGDDDDDPTVVVAIWKRNKGNTAWISAATGSGGTGGDASTLEGHPAADFALVGVAGGQVVDDAADLDDALGFTGAVVVDGEVLPMFWDAVNSEWVSPPARLSTGNENLQSTSTADQVTYADHNTGMHMIKRWVDVGLTAQIRLRADLRNADGATTTTLGLDVYYFNASGVFIETVLPTGLTNVGTEKVVEGVWQDIPAGAGVPTSLWCAFWLKTSNGANQAQSTAHTLELRFRKT